MIIGAVILLAAAALLWWLAGRATAKAFHMKATETSRVGELVSLVKEIAADMPGDMATGFSQYVEVKGKVQCDTPIVGEFCSVPAAIVQTEVKRVVERREERRDAQGNTRTEWRKSTETVSTNRREAPFWIDDGSGRIRVKTTNKGVDLLEEVDRFEPASAIENLSGGNMTLSLGTFRLSTGGFSTGSSSRTLGYRFIESILPVGRQVYALGEAADIEDEGLVLRKPESDDKKRPYLISTKSEADLVKGSEKKATIMRVCAGVAAAGGVALLVAGLV